MREIDDKDLAIVAVAVMGLLWAWMTRTADGLNLAIGAIAGMATGRK